MLKSLFIGIVLSTLGLYLIFSSRREGREVMDWYRDFYRKLGLKRMAQNITKKDEEQESKGSFIGGIICLLFGIYGIIAFLHYHLS